MNTLDCALIIIILVQALLHRIERKDLYNRLMCKSINEYTSIGKPHTDTKSGHNRVLNKWRGKGGV